MSILLYLAMWGNVQNSRLLAGSVLLQIEGSVECIAYSEGQPTRFLSRFTVQVEDCKIHIKASIDGDSDIESHEYYSDSQTSLIILRYRKTPISDMPEIANWEERDVSLDKPVYPENEGGVLVCPDSIPLYGFEYLTAPWIAYGARCRFDQNGKGAVIPIIQIGKSFQKNRLKAECNWKLNESDPGFLEYLAEMADGYMYDLKDGQLRNTKHPSPFDKGFTNALYKTTSWTNVSGMAIPLTFELQKFTPNYSRNGKSELGLAYIIRGAADSIQIAERGVMGAMIPLRSRVVDYTLDNSEMPYSYGVTNGLILSKLEALEVKLRPLPRHATPFPVRLFVFGLLFFSALIPIALVIRKVWLAK